MKLIQSSTSMISENITIILRVVANHSREFKMQVRESALTSGTLLKHFHHAIFSPYEGQRVLSRCLCGMWMNGADSAERHLLGRMIPAGFFSYLKMPPLSLEEEEQLDSLEWSEEQVEIFDCTSGSGTNIVRLRLRMKIAETEQGSNSDAESNFRIFFHVLTQDHSLPDLIWSSHTRTDLETALVSEIKSIQEEIAARGGSQAIAWNHEQFRVPYLSLEKELKVGSVYMRLWLEASDSFIKTWDDPVRLFELLFRKLLCEFDRNVLVRVRCITFFFFLIYSDTFWILSGYKHLSTMYRTFVCLSWYQDWAVSRHINFVTVHENVKKRSDKTKNSLFNCGVGWV
jgi:hypothetical protein